jgi:phospholipase D1/2
VQLLRSASPWSIGLQSKEFSIHAGYIEAILNAKRFIYIENQFFISSTSPLAEDSSKIRNRVVKALFARIRKAILSKERFRVIVFIPLLPAFEADLEKQQGKVMQFQVGLENNTIGVGPFSLLERIKLLTDSPDDYIMFCGLRRFQERADKSEIPTTNLIYIHSKVPVADAADDRRRQAAADRQREPQRPESLGVER